MLVSWNWVKEYLGETDLTAEKAAELLGQHAFEIEEIEEKGRDTVIDIDILPNRSSDCLCHRGIARELTSITGNSLSKDPLATEPELPGEAAIAVDIESAEICPRFTASLITGIEVKESPAWLKERLEVIGQRSINNIVDATNYVMLAIGQPLHAYDADLFPQVDGAWQFGVRVAKEGEVVSLLAEGGKDEDRDVELKGTETLIIDKSSSTPIGLAGVKGGRFAGVHAGTTKVIIEAAHFHPTITRKTARGLGIVIDASKRFENEPARDLPPYAQSEIIKLITDIAGGVCEGYVDTYLEEKKNQAVSISPEKTNALLGLDLSQAQMVELLTQAGCIVSYNDSTITATGPFERTDLNIEEDFIEEIGRLHGYDHVASVVPATVSLKELNKRHYYSEKIRDSLTRLGFNEVITSSFRKKDEVSLLNALATDKGCMRSSLITNLTEVLDKNAGFADLLGAKDTRVFEIGTVFEKGGELGVTEHMSLTMGVRVKSSSYSKQDQAILAEAIGELTNDLDVDLSFDEVDGVAELNLTELLTKLPEPAEYEAVTVGEEIQYRPFSAYPHMSRDIAMWVSNSPGDCSTKEDVEQVLNRYAGPLRVRTTLFDEFSKDDKVSFAFRLVFQSEEKTLTDEEVNAVMDEVYKAVADKGWEVR